MLQDEDDGEVTKNVKGAGTEDFENDLQTNTSAFEALERDFQEVRNYAMNMIAISLNDLLHRFCLS